MVHTWRLLSGDGSGRLRVLTLFNPLYFFHTRRSSIR